MKYHFQRSLHVLPVLLFGIYLFGFEYIPTQDYPDWLYQGFVFNKFVFHGNTFGGFFGIHHYLPPNLISTLGIGILALVFPIMISGKIFLFVILLLLYFGIYRFLIFFGVKDRYFAMAVAFYLSFNYHFFCGNVSFLFGLGLALLAFTVAVSHNKLQNFWWMMLIFLMLYLSHFLAMVIFGIMLLSYAISEKKLRILTSSAIAAIPVILIFCHYYFTKSIPSSFTTVPEIFTKKFANPLSFYFISKLWNFLVVQVPFHQFEGVSEIPIAMEYANYAIALFTILLALYSVKRTIINKDRSFAGMITIFCLILCAILPFNFGGLSNPSERLVVLMIIATIAHLLPRWKNIRFLKILTLAMVVLCAMSFAWDIYNTSRFSSKLFTGSTITGSIGFNYIQRFSGIDPFGRSMIYYPAIKESKPVPIFSTGLFYIKDTNSLNQPNTHSN